MPKKRKKVRKKTRTKKRTRSKRSQHPRKIKHKKIISRKKRVKRIVASPRRRRTHSIPRRRVSHPRAPPVTINMPPMPSATQQQPQQQSVNKILIENFVSLQRVLTNLSSKMDDLTNKISKLLEIFEISARALAERDFDTGEDKKELVGRLDSLLDQNRTLARGIALMHERIPRETIPFPPQMPPTINIQQPMMSSMIPLSSPSTKEIGPDYSNMIPSQMGIGPLPPPPRPPSNLEGPISHELDFPEEDMGDNESSEPFEQPMEEE